MGNPKLVHDLYRRAGMFVRAQREASKMSIEEVVQKLEKQGIDTSISSLSRLELGDGSRALWGDPVFVNALADALGVSSIELMVALGTIKKVNGTGKERLFELADKIDPANQATAEQLLQVIVAQQEKGKNG